MVPLTRATRLDNRRLLALAGATFALVWFLVLARRQVSLGSNGVALWWAILCAIGVGNVFGLERTALTVLRCPGSPEASVRRLERWQLLLSAAFVLGCAFRSILPRGDIQRIGLVDTWLSSILVGRAVATVAELCFSAQWALLLGAVARAARCRPAAVIAWLLVPLIASAECCSWVAVLTTCYLGSVFEEALWTLTAALLMVGCLALWPADTASRRLLLTAALVVGLAYLAFMCTVDIPMYLTRWQADEADGRVYLSLAQGWHDAWSRRVVTFDWDAWQTEMPWMTLYFSAAVWWSLALVHVPRLLHMN